MKTDTRYTIKLEWCGYKEQRYIVRFCGDWIGQAGSRKEAEIFIKHHKQMREA